MLRSITGPANLAFHRFLLHSEINVRIVFFESLKKDISNRYSAKNVTGSNNKLLRLYSTVGENKGIIWESSSLRSLQPTSNEYMAIKGALRDLFYSTFLIQLKGRLHPNVNQPFWSGLCTNGCFIIIYNSCCAFSLLSREGFSSGGIFRSEEVGRCEWDMVMPAPRKRESSCGQNVAATNLTTILCFLKNISWTPKYYFLGNKSVIIIMVDADLFLFSEVVIQCSVASLFEVWVWWA